MSPSDLPKDELLEDAARVRQEFGERGVTVDVYFKFTCEGCGKRCTFKEPNTLYSTGECECGYVTTVEKGGYLLAIRLREKEGEQCQERRVSMYAVDAAERWRWR